MMHYTEKRKLKLTSNALQDWAEYMRVVTMQESLSPDMILNEVFIFHAINIRDKVFVSAYKARVLGKKSQVWLNKGEVYVLIKIFDRVPLTPLMQVVRREVNQGI